MVVVLVEGHPGDVEKDLLGVLVGVCFFGQRILEIKAGVLNLLGQPATLLLGIKPREVQDRVYFDCQGPQF